MVQGQGNAGLACLSSEEEAEEEAGYDTETTCELVCVYVCTLGLRTVQHRSSINPSSPPHSLIDFQAC